jgi:FtsZ-binding cell division protein ZapB
MSFTIFDQIERFIIEHGSASILRERVALLKEKHSVLEKQVVELQTQAANLQSENESLQMQLADANGKIKRYENALKHRTTGPQLAEGVDENPFGF